jgi:hypothetical protein
MKVHETLEQGSHGKRWLAAIRKSNTTHGMRRTPEYMVWSDMRNRCQNPKNRSWNRYGGRGISVCERWESFSNFIEDMGQRPSNFHEIDRIENDGNYEPTNCRWATASVQNSNKSNTHLITAFGKTQCLKHWAGEIGITPATLRRRFSRKWNLEAALSTRSLGKGRPLGSKNLL